MLSFLFNQLPGSATDQEHPKLHGNRNSAVSEAVHPREKKQRSLQSFFQTAQVCRTQHSDDVGIPHHVVPSRSHNDCSWCRSPDRNKAPGGGLNHPGLSCRECLLLPRFHWKYLCSQLYKVSSAQIIELPGEAAKTAQCWRE